MGRKSVAEQQLRRREVMKLMLKGKNCNDIFLALHQHHNVKLKTIEVDITACGKQMRELAKIQAAELIDESLNRYENMYMEARELGDIKEARAQQRAKEDVVGIHKQDPATPVQILNLSGIPTETLVKIKEALNKNNEDTQD